MTGVAAQAPAGHAPAAGSLDAIAARLSDIAATVSREAEAATQMIRGMATRSRDIAALAADLEHLADRIEEDVRRQAGMLADARRSFAANEPTIAALSQSAGSVAAISVTIAAIARQSQLLALNARIEATRHGAEGRGFAEVAREMTTLALQTRDATGDIATRTHVIGDNVGRAKELVDAHGALVSTQDRLVAEALASAERQRATAAALATITMETAMTAEDAAAAVGRVGASAAAAKLLARQIERTLG